MRGGFNDRLVAALRRPLVPALLAGGVMLLLLGFLAGSRYLGGEMEAKRVLVAAVEAAREELELQRQQLINNEIAAQVDRQSLEQVRKAVAKLESELLERQQELELYRNLVKDDGQGDGLYIEPPRISGGEPAGYSYRIAVRQRAAVLKSVKVAVDVTIKGDLDGKPKTFALAELDPSLGKGRIEVTFKYFQVIEGTLHLPPGFQPRQLVVALSEAGSRARKEETFNWLVEKL